jgi:hypothetical protein
MANKRPKAPSFTTPKGTFRFPKLSEVDFGAKEFPKAEGEYSVQLVLRADDPDTQALIEKLKPLHEAALQRGDTAFKALKAETRKKLGQLKVNDLYTELLDQDTEEPTGELVFKFAARASGEYKNGSKAGQFWDTRPTVFDVKTNVLIQGFRFRDRADDEKMADVHVKSSPGIWGGSTGKVSFEVGIDKDGEPGYFIPGTGAAGLKLALNAVQVIDLVSAGQRSAEDYGFGNEADEPAEAETVGSDDNGSDF